MEQPSWKKIAKVAAFVALYILLFGTFVMALWNWLMPTLFDLPMITFSQGLGLFVLGRILTGGFKIGTGFSSRRSDDEDDEKWSMKKQMLDSWKNASPEERDRLKNEWKTLWRERCDDSRRPIGFNKPHTGQKECQDDELSV
jgi:hypothetical protein